MNFQAFSLQLETPAQMFSCKFCEIFDNVFTIKPFHGPTPPTQKLLPTPPTLFFDTHNPRDPRKFSTHATHAPTRPTRPTSPRNPTNLADSSQKYWKATKVMSLKTKKQFLFTYTCWSSFWLEFLCTSALNEWSHKLNWILNVSQRIAWCSGGLTEVLGSFSLDGVSNGIRLNQFNKIDQCNWYSY